MRLLRKLKEGLVILELVATVKKAWLVLWKI